MKTCLPVLSIFCLTHCAAFQPVKRGYTSRGTTFTRRTNTFIFLASPKSDPAAQDALEKTAAHLQKLTRQQKPTVDEDGPPDPLGVERERLYREYLLQPANSLKEQLKARKLPRNGRKPDLAVRLAEDDLKQTYGSYSEKGGLKDDEDDAVADDVLLRERKEEMAASKVSCFAGITLSDTAGTCLGRAGFNSPTLIQACVIPKLAAGESLIIHAETGGGKTLAYLLPVTEMLWSNRNSDDLYVVMTPTRELAAQVAGIASVLAPPNSVRFVSRATNLMSDGSKDRGEMPTGGRFEADPSGLGPRLFVGSAKAIMQSLYGGGKMPVSPTPKPHAMTFLRNIRYLVMDEVDRLLGIQKSRGDKQYKKIHEKPAAVVCAAVARLTLGKAQVVAASATVGRPLKREVARVLGQPPHECPPVVRAVEREEGERGYPSEEALGTHIGRAVTIPNSVENYVFSVDDSSPGKLLTAAYGIIKTLGRKPRRMLLVLSRGFGINTQNVIGAMKHFSCKPEPRSLLDALEADGTEQLMEVHREVSGATGVGQSDYFKRKDASKNNDGYLFVTGEDTIRGLHLDGLDFVLVVGRPNGPDEYTHVAGRTGRAGRKGRVINILSKGDSSSLISWERMLGVKFARLTPDDVASLD